MIKMQIVNEKMKKNSETYFSIKCGF